MSFITANTGQFPYFDAQLDRPEWRGKRVLDFGGNIGNILHHPDSTIDREKYWCLDVSRDAIEAGKRACPGAHFIFYDRYSFEYNPQGIQHMALPDFGSGFDYILALSVFTHTSKAEMLDLISELRAWLNPGGVLAFTFHEPHYVPEDAPTSNLRHYLTLRLKDRSSVEPLVKKAAGAKWCTLAGQDLYVEHEDLRHYELWEKGGYLAFYSSDYIAGLVPDGEIRPPVSPFSRHHCCVLKYSEA